MPEPGEPTPLARRYRWLLVTYPRAYRRARGEELVDTMLDAAPPGRRWPAAREAANLLRHGLRARLGRPGSRLIVPLSVLTALTVGLFGATLGSLLAWRTTGPLPDTPRVYQIFHTAVPDPVTDTQLTRDDFYYGYPSETSTWRTLEMLVGIRFGDDFGPGGVELSARRSPATDHHRYTAAARDRLHAAGWQVSRLTLTPDPSCTGRPCGSTTDTASFTARKGGLILQFGVGRNRDGLLFSTAFSRAAPDLLPAELAGGLVAALLCWPLFAWASRRTEHRTRSLRRTVHRLYGAMMICWLVPVGLIVLYGARLLAHPGSPEYQLVPGAGLIDLMMLPGLLPELLGGLAAVAVIVVAALPQSRFRDPRPGGHSTKSQYDP